MDNNKYRKYEERVCSTCNSPFQARSDSKSHFCSSKCFGKSIVRNNPKICPICDTVFSSRKLDQVYCSNKCSQSTRSTKIEVICNTCGKVTSRRLADILNSKHLYCSKECYWKSSKLSTKENSNRWKGGVWNHDGYIYLRQEDGKYKAEHRIVMEKYLGRFLTNLEVIHHTDFDRSNNVISNLQIMTRAEHIEIHREGLYPKK